MSGILDKAVRLTIGDLPKTTIVKMRVKRMAAEDIKPDRYGEPPDVLRGDLRSTYPYGEGLFDADLYENGLLLRIPGRESEWFFKPRVNQGFQKAGLLVARAKLAGGKVPKDSDVKRSGSEFMKAADKIKPDLARMPSPKEMGGYIEDFGFKGFTVQKYRKGILLHYGDRVEWFKKDRKSDALNKARLIANAYKVKRIFSG